MIRTRDAASLLERLTPALARAGGAGPPEVLEDLARAIERRHHLALLAAEGAGLGALYAAVALIDLADLEEPAEADGGVRGLLLAATPDRARRLAERVESVCGPEGVHALVWSPHAAEAADPPPADLIAGRPEPLLASVRAGRLGLAGLRLLVVDDVASLEPAWPAVEGILAACDAETRKVAASHRRSEAFERFVERTLPRARRWPPELWPARGESEPAPAAGQATLRYASAASEEARRTALARAIHELARAGSAERVRVRCDDEATARRLTAALAAEGFAFAGGPDEPGIAISCPPDAPEPGDAAIRFGLPSDLEELRATLEPADARFAIVASRHVPQLELCARRLGWSSRPLGAPPGEAARDEIEAFREGVRRATEAEDLAPHLLLLEPLLREEGADRVAAALAALLRRASRPAAGGAEPAVPPPGGEAERAARPAWTRIFLNVGKRDGAGPGDLVGAITGETEATGAQIGRIDVRGTHSLVEIDSMIADEVLRKLRGARIKGREMAPRLDRGG